jgi:DNA-binding NarL/FixJ family response regulator
MSFSKAGAFSSVVSNPESGDRPRVVVVSDVRLYRDGLAASLARDGGLEGAAALPAAGAPAASAALAPDAVLLEASTDGALALARRIRAASASTRLVGFGIAGGADDYLACAEAGLAAFVDSNGTVAELVEAVASAIRGELNCSPRTAALLCDRLASLTDAKERHPATEPLTRRERQVAALVAEGLSNKEIASDLRIGPATVKNHVHNILDKLRVRRRAAVAAQLRERTPGWPGAPDGAMA